LNRDYHKVYKNIWQKLTNGCLIGAVCSNFHFDLNDKYPINYKNFLLVF
jgi:hypothetical protein